MSTKKLSTTFSTRYGRTRRDYSNVKPSTRTTKTRGCNCGGRKTK